MSYKTILALDPSGNFTEGKGTTGWCLLSEDKEIIKTGFIAADDYGTPQSYWDAHIDLISYILSNYPNTGMVIEDYLLYENKAKSQIHSRMETPKLIGVIQHFLWSKGLRYVMQPASEVKNRWADPILVHKNIIQKKNNRFYVNNKPVNRHVKDAIRHAVHYATFKNKKKESA